MTKQNKNLSYSQEVLGNVEENGLTTLQNALIQAFGSEIKVSSHNLEKSVKIEAIPDKSLVMLFAYGVSRKFNDTINSIKTDETKNEDFYLREIENCILRLKDGWESSNRASSTSALKLFILKALIKKGVLKKETADKIKGLEPLKMLCEAYPDDTESKNQERLDKYSELFDMVNNTDID